MWGRYKWVVYDYSAIITERKGLTVNEPLPQVLGFLQRQRVNFLDVSVLQIISLSSLVNICSIFIILIRRTSFTELLKCD